MSTNDGAREPSDAEKFEAAVRSKKVDLGRRPARHAPETLAQRQAKLRRCGVVMLCIMAGGLLLTGAVGSIKWENALTRAIYANPEHRYALAALNVSSGLIFWIALIGVYLSVRWGLKLNVIGCAWYLVGTMLIEVLEPGKVVWTESIADVVFWSAFPIVQIVCLLAGTSSNPAFVGGPDSAESPDA